MTYPFMHTRRLDGQKIYADWFNELQLDTEDLSALPNFATARVMALYARVAGTTIDVVGTQAPSIGGTASTSDDADGAFHLLTSGAVSGNAASWTMTATPMLRRDWDSRFVARIKTGATLTTVRHWVGMFSADPSASATPAVHYAAFRYDTTADSASAVWRTVTDSGTGTPAKTDTTVAVAASTAYTMRIRLSATDVKFYINDVLVATHTSTLPTTTTGLGYYVGVTTLAASARTIKVGRIQMSTK
jgi:hypothetical protein